MDNDLRESGGLSQLFLACADCTPDQLLNREFRKNTLRRETEILLGQQSGSVSGIQERGASANNSPAKQAERRKASEKRAAEFIGMVERLNAYMDRLAADIENLEDKFRQRDGEEWREKLALKILDADDIPVRRDGESMEDYRERLEILLIDEMLNSDGKIKDDYKNHPELGDYAEWAQKQNNLNNARATVAELEDPDATPERREQILDEMRERGITEEMMLAAKAATDQHMQDRIKIADDSEHDEVLAQKQISDVALKFNS